MKSDPEILSVMLHTLRRIGFPSCYLRVSKMIVIRRISRLCHARVAASMLGSTVLSVLCICGCSEDTGFNGLINLECNVGNETTLGMVDTSFDALKGVTRITSISRDRDIEEDRLASLSREVMRRDQMLRDVIPNDAGVFYVSHSIENTDVSLRFRGEGSFVCNGKELNEPLLLEQDAHGFRLEATSAAVYIEHVYHKAR